MVCVLSACDSVRFFVRLCVRCALGGYRSERSIVCSWIFGCLCIGWVCVVFACMVSVSFVGFDLIVRLIGVAALILKN